MIYGVANFPILLTDTLVINGLNKYTLPVSQDLYIYSHFRHVAGIPAKEGEGGVSITRLKILDTLIEHLSQLKKKPAPALPTELSDTQIDLLIEQYSREIQAAQAFHENFPYRPGLPTSQGILVNLVA